jgi:hypothetical protein
MKMPFELIQEGVDALLLAESAQALAPVRFAPGVSRRRSN